MLHCCSVYYVRTITMSSFESFSRMQSECVCMCVYYYSITYSWEIALCSFRGDRKTQIHSECTDENSHYHIIFHAIISFLPINKWKLIMCKSVVVNIRRTNSNVVCSDKSHPNSILLQMFGKARKRERKKKKHSRGKWHHNQVRSIC